MAIPEASGRLAGTRIIITRPAESSAALVEKLSLLGAEVVSLPLIEIRPASDWGPLDRAIDRLESFDWLIAASVNAVDYFLRRFDQRGRDRRLLAGLLIAAVGPKTRQRIERAGLRAALVPDRYTAAALVETIIGYYRDEHRLRGLQVLIPSSNITRDVIRPALVDHGVEVALVEAYQTTLPVLSREEALARLNPSLGGYLLFASPSAVDNLARVLESEDLAGRLEGLQILCLGPTTAQAAAQHNLRAVQIPSEYQDESWIDLIIGKKRER